MRTLGINAIFHDPAAALVVDGLVVAAAEEERFSRRKHGKRPVPFSAWELPELSLRWCLAEAGLRPQDLDAVAYLHVISDVTLFTDDALVADRRAVTDVDVVPDTRILAEGDVVFNDRCRMCSCHIKTFP